MGIGKDDFTADQEILYKNYVLEVKLEIKKKALRNLRTKPAEAAADMK